MSQWLAPIVLLLVTLFATLSHAQITFREEVAPALSPPDFATIKARLALIPDQAQAADRLYDAYLTEHQRAATAYKKGWRDYLKASKWVDDHEEAEPGAREALHAAQQAWFAAKPGTQRTFLADLKSTLDDAQAQAA